MNPPAETALAAVRSRIVAACARARRSPADVQLVAVTKTVAPERIRAMLAAGQTLFGENRVQEALGKISELGPQARWHLIGHLQRNKVRQAVGVFDLLHGVDSIELAREIDRRAAAAGRVQAVLVQVNVGDEETKSGVSVAELPALLDGVAGCPALELRGLMAVPPPVERAEQSRGWFARLRELRDQASRRLLRPLPELSMGMTDDFEVAIEEGATLVRVGRALFGERPRPGFTPSPH